MQNRDAHIKAISLRKQGYTYKEINANLKTKIAKSTLSYWFKNLSISPKTKEELRVLNLKNLVVARKASLIKCKENRDKFINSLISKNQHLEALLANKDIAKIALGVLYLAEGSKKRRGALMFGNSDSGIISLFLYLFRSIFIIDETKFRCTVQTRADCNIKKSELFWHNITKIPKNQFYKARIDPRTIGKKTNKPDYMGVCRIDYFSGSIFLELQEIGKILCKGL